MKGKRKTITILSFYDTTMCFTTEKSRVETGEVGTADRISLRVRSALVMRMPCFTVSCW